VPLNHRKDGPLKDILYTNAGVFKVDIGKALTNKARELIQPEWGALAIIVEPYEIAAVTNFLKTTLKVYHSMIVGTQSPVTFRDGDRDSRALAFFEARAQSFRSKGLYMYF
jgi:hypothetical protein